MIDWVFCLNEKTILKGQYIHQCQNNFNTNYLNDNMTGE